MELMAEIGERLVRFRTQAGMDVEAAAASADVEPDRLCLAEAGHLALSEVELSRLAGAYGVDVTEIFGGRITPFQNYAGA